MPRDTDQGQSIGQLDWRRLTGYLRPYWRRMGLALLALLLSSGFGLAFPLVIVRLLDSVTKAGSSGNLDQLALILVGIFLLQAGFGALQSYLLSYIGERIVYDLRTALYRQLQQLSLEFYSKRRVGDVVSRLTSDVTQMRAMLTTNLAQLLSQVVTLIGAVAIVLTLNARLTLFILALLPVLVVVAGFFGRWVQRFSRQVQDQLAGATVIAEEGLQGVRVVKSFGREAYETERYQEAAEGTFRASLRMAVAQSLFMALMMFLGFGSIVAIMWYGGREVIAGRLDLATMTGFLMYGIAIATSLGGLAQLYGQLRAAIGGVERVFEILDRQPSVQDAPGAVELPPVRGRLTFTDVSFFYEPAAPVLQNVSLTVEPGEVLALIGPSGAGKSTLLNLIPRFYDATAGTVCIDGHDVRTVTQRSLREQIGIVPQETLLFGGTIRENIRYGRLEATDEELIAAARAANAHDFIRGLPAGYDTIVGERGMNLSGGQRQRVAIARAILKSPRILLLDEATSSLDNESEQLVQEALERLMKNRTTVIIAHRLSTIKVADRIAVLNAGQIAELGTHDELIARGGLYARLYAMQFRNLAEGAAEPAGDIRELDHDGTPYEEPAAPGGLLGMVFGPR
ncbi:MAG TPA: ABC transporter ATP-binding protein [Chloroflexota bacterium]|nr:ABC transporter ATP-binding protein [Chloroflexota bacterium]